MFAIWQASALLLLLVSEMLVGSRGIRLSFFARNAAFLEGVVRKVLKCLLLSYDKYLRCFCWWCQKWRIRQCRALSWPMQMGRLPPSPISSRSLVTRLMWMGLLPPSNPPQGHFVQSVAGLIGITDLLPPSSPPQAQRVLSWLIWMPTQSPPWSGVRSVDWYKWPLNSHHPCKGLGAMGKQEKLNPIDYRKTILSCGRK